ncbi:MAG: hypothetical protein WCT53_02720, partial [Candidatus Gracilibacteria bacterium]
RITVTDGEPSTEEEVNGDTEGKRYIYPTLHAQSTTSTTVTTTSHTTTTEPVSTAEFGRNINDMSASSTQKTDQEDPRMPDTKLNTNDFASVNHGNGEKDRRYTTSRLQHETPLTEGAYQAARDKVTTTMAEIREAAAAARAKVEQQARAHAEKERASSKAGQTRGQEAYTK